MWGGMKERGGRGYTHAAKLTARLPDGWFRHVKKIPIWEMGNTRNLANHVYA